MCPSAYKRDRLSLEALFLARKLDIRAFTGRSYAFDVIASYVYARLSQTLANISWLS